MEYIFNVRMKQMSREELNDQLDTCITNLIFGLVVCNIAVILYLIIQVFTKHLLLVPTLVQVIEITIPFGLEIMMLNGIEDLLFLQYKDLPVGISGKSAVIMKCLKIFGPFMCWLFVAIVYL